MVWLLDPLRIRNAPAGVGVGFTGVVRITGSGVAVGKPMDELHADKRREPVKNNRASFEEMGQPPFTILVIILFLSCLQNFSKHYKSAGVTGTGHTATT